MSQDNLSDLLRSVRLRGALFFEVDCAERWVTEAPRASEMAPATLPGAEHLVACHVVIRGECWAALPNEAPVRLAQGDVIVFPHGDAHVMSSAPGLRAQPQSRCLFEERPPTAPFMRQEGIELHSPGPPQAAASPHASLLCGFLGCELRPFNPLLSALPRMIHAPSAATGSGAWMVHLVHAALAESREMRPGAQSMLERLGEMMFIDLLRRHLPCRPGENTGWLSGLGDPHVGRVLGLMHERPQHAWTLGMLAERTGLSRSSLHERFVQFIGVPPMHYLAQWRMQTASRLLTQSTAPVASIALESGYESEAAFSRAFKRSVGVPPSVWRRQRRAARASGGASAAHVPQGPQGSP